jgi:hypothetical protein
VVQVFGKFQRFEYGNLSATLNLSDFAYKVGVGDTFLEQIGYDRTLGANLEPDMFYGWGGASHVEGPPYEAPFEFAWQLQYLSGETYANLMAVVRTAIKARSPVRLIDGLLVLDEVAPRTRAKVGGYEENVNGIVYFYPVFDVWLKLGKTGRSGGRHSQAMTGKEWSPDRKVQSDIAA